MLKYDLEGHFLYSWGTWGDFPGGFWGVHGFSVDQDGNFYVAEVDNGRAQKFRRGPARIQRSWSASPFIRPGSNAAIIQAMSNKPCLPHLGHDCRESHPAGVATWNPTRRDLLTGLTVVGAGALFPWAQALAQKNGGNPRRIDVHHHFTPPEYQAYTAAHPGAGGFGRGGGRGRGGAGNGGRAGGRGGALGSARAGWMKHEEDMDKNGTETAILSITTPGFWFGEVDENRKVMRACNEFAAKLRSDHPGRFGNFAALPMTDPDGALKEIEYSLDTLKADGIGLFFSPITAISGSGMNPSIPSTRS